MILRRLSAGLAVLVLVATVLVVIGVGEGHPPHKLKISPAAERREIAAVRSGSVEVHHGEQLFDEHGCSDCHTMAAGGYGGRIGPRLDVQSQGDSVKAITKNIKDPPDDDKGYPADLMPDNFGSRLSQSDLHALAVYVHAAASAAKGS